MTQPTSSSTTPPAAPDWDLVRLAETSRSALTGRVAAEIARGRRDYRTLPEGLVGPRVRSVQENAANRARLERFSDHVLTGERVVEVGPGWGFVGARMLAAGAASYRAMDLDPACVKRTTRVLTALGLEDRLGPITEKDLYTLTPADLEDASLVVCSEVIEHVPDPEAALATLGAALPAGADLLFSVPLLGRIEHVWGHLSIFTADRLEAMLRAADLEAVHVEPLADHWVVVLASRAGGVDAAEGRTRERLDRLRVGAQEYGDVPRDITPADSMAPLPPQPTHFDNVPLESVRFGPLPHPGSARVTITPADGPKGVVTAEIGARRSLLRRPATGGVALSLAGLDPVQGIRLELALDAPADVEEVVVTARGGSTPLARWTWRLDARDRKRTGPKTFSLRPGPDQAPFVAPRTADLTGADRFEVTATVRAGRTVRMEISRVAWVR